MQGNREMRLKKMKMRKRYRDFAERVIRIWKDRKEEVEGIGI